MRFHPRPAWIAAALLLTAAPAAWAVAQADTSAARFASLDAERANLRTGPGERYPVAWVFKRERLPLAVLGDHGAWRRVRAWDGTTGWMHAGLLSGRRTVQVVGDYPRQLRADPRADGEVVARLQPNVVGALGECRPRWCKATFAELTGWVRRRHLFGAPPGGGAPAP